MIKTKKDLKEYLEYEEKKYFKKKPNIIKKILLRNTSDEKMILWRYQKYLRKYEFNLNTNNKLLTILYKYKMQKLGKRYGLHIAPNSVQKGLKIMHLGSVLVNYNTKIGRDCSLHINVAIVAGGRTNKAPIIGDNCVIGVGATLLGEITIGDNCAIGAGAVVNKSFGDNVTIAGVPAKVISNNNSSTWGK